MRNATYRGLFYASVAIYTGEKEIRVLHQCSSSIQKMQIGNLIKGGYGEVQLEHTDAYIYSKIGIYKHVLWAKCHTRMNTHVQPAILWVKPPTTKPSGYYFLHHVARLANFEPRGINIYAVGTNVLAFMLLWDQQSHFSQARHYKTLLKPVRMLANP